MNFENEINDLKMDKKTYKKVSKGKAYDLVYEPMVDLALGIASDLDKSEELLQSAEEDVRVSKKEARESKKLADEATARAESAESKVNEARELQTEAKTALKLLNDEINTKVLQSESARTKCAEANEEFTRAMGENLTLSAENADIKKATVNTNNEEFAKAFEGFKRSRMDENERQMALNKESANNAREKSVEYRVEAEGYERRIQFLEEQRNKALIAYAEACLNMNLGE